jgi:putative ABC transport system substrate-binding protein
LAKVELSLLEGQFDRPPALIADLARRRVAVIAAIGVSVALAAKSGDRDVPIVFGVGEDPVRRGLAASLSGPGGNAPASILSR